MGCTCVTVVLLILLLNDANHESLFAMELEKLRVNGKITASCELDMTPKEKKNEL